MNRVYKTIRRTVKNAELALSFAFCMRMVRRTPDIKFVKKTMPECTGREILEELLGHLQFDQDEVEKNEILDTATCIPCMLPYSTSQFLSRAKGDRPAVVPAGSKNFAFLGQFVEIPNGIVFTTEYSVLGAIHAVKKFVKPSLVVPPMYFGQYHPLTCISVARALVR
jgi:oleate hydratase